MSRARVKICGINTAAALAASAAADFVGFVFYPPSPRAVTVAQAAAISAAHPGGPRRVGLFVDAEDTLLNEAAPLLDMIQLHGAETPARVAEIRARFGRPVMKALGIGSRADLAGLARFKAADLLLLDAKPEALPGGNAHAFDWALLAGARLPPLWMLAGGLTPLNVAEAIAATGAPAVDVSSGVESSRGVKDAGLIAAFIAAARGTTGQPAVSTAH